MSPRPLRRRFAPLVIAWLALALGIAAQDARLPNAPDSVKFAVIGDNGDGSREQYEVGRQMAAARERFPFEFVIMVGDNMYGRQKAEDYVTKFERPYADILRAGVPFHAALGNHDDPAQVNYKGYGMNGQRYYTFVKKDVRFFVFDTNKMDPKQLAWVEQALASSSEPWKICYFHHPLYSNASRHGSDVELRVALEPLFVKYNVNVALSGHDHSYERIRPQKGITYFVEGSSGKLRKGGISPGQTTAAYFDQDQTFMLVEIAGDRLYFQTFSRTGQLVDSGVVPRRVGT